MYFDWKGRLALHSPVAFALGEFASSPEGLKASAQKPLASLSNCSLATSAAAAGPSGCDPVRESHTQMYAPSSVEVTCKEGGA
jgi:hypothetical protein